jgi:hypothetical protein
MFVQYECGANAHPDWLNFEAVPRLFENPLEQAGFEDILACSFNHGTDPEFAEVEIKARFCDEGLGAVALEAVRP